MKPILLLIVFSSMVIRTEASGLKLQIEGRYNTSYVVSVGHHEYLLRGNMLNLETMHPGNHFVTISNNRFGPYGATQRVVIYQGNIYIPARSNVFAYLNRNRQMSIQVNSWGHGHNVYTPDFYYPTQQPAPPVYQGMHPENFRDLIRTLNNTSFENQRLVLAKQAISSNSVNSRQVLELMETFDFESSKLEVAKFSYGYVADPQNYYVVNNGFSFSSSVQELDRFIQ